MIAYVCTIIPGLTEAVRVTRIGDGERDLTVRSPTVYAAASAILRDYGVSPAPEAIRALQAVAFGGLDEHAVMAVTVRAAQIERVAEAVGRTA